MSLEAEIQNPIEDTKTSIQVYKEGDCFFDAVRESIEQAEVDLKLEFYVFEYDTIGKEILEALKSAAARQVKVQLMVDGFGSAADLDELIQFCSPTEIALKVYHPLPFSRQYRWGRFSKHGWFWRSFKMFGWANSRDHRKLVIVDDQKVFMGGMNIWQVHSERASGSKAWRDLSFCIENEECSELCERYQYNWERALFPKQSRLLNYRGRRKKHEVSKTSSRYLLNDDPPNKKMILKQLCERVRQAKKRVIISTPYFNPDRHILQALYKVCKNGVELKILLPSFTDIWMTEVMNKNFYGALLSRGAQIFEYQPTMYHSKWAIIDDEVIAGSSNLNMRSLVHDLELQAVFKEPEILQKIEEIYSEDLSRSKEISFEDWKNIFWPKRMLWRSLMLLRRWL